MSLSWYLLRAAWVAEVAVLLSFMTLVVLLYVTEGRPRDDGYGE